MREFTENNIQYFTFDSVGDAVKQMSKPNSALFGYKSASGETSEFYTGWTGTKTFDEAFKLLETGWTEGAMDIEKKLQAIKNVMQPVTKIKATYDVVGHQASVPRYLQGIPTNMVNVKKIPDKKKVVTINKSITYNSGVSAAKIIEESVKALAVVYKLEQTGIRVNLNIIMCTMFQSDGGSGSVMFKVRVKDSSERMNVGKMAFAMAHPSMLRRMYFKLIETTNINCPYKLKMGFTSNYGSAMSDSKLKAIVSKDGEYYLPAFFTKEIDKINSINDL